MLDLAIYLNMSYVSGTMQAACDLMEAAGAVVQACQVVIELTDLKGKDKLKYPLMSYIS